MSEPAGKRRYCCSGRNCDGTRMLPQSAPETVRIGCPDCGGMRHFRRWNSVAMASYGAEVSTHV